MGSEGYPILVERLDSRTAVLAICQSCGHESEAAPDEPGFNDGEWPCGCGGWVCFKYVEADHKCPNCGKLGFFEKPLAPCCSRRCQLQADYAAQLAGAHNEK
jgi:hypothetical protein